MDSSTVTNPDVTQRQASTDESATLNDQVMTTFQTENSTLPLSSSQTANLAYDPSIPMDEPTKQQSITEPASNMVESGSILTPQSLQNHPSTLSLNSANQTDDEITPQTLASSNATLQPSSDVLGAETTVTTPSLPDDISSTTTFEPLANPNQTSSETQPSLLSRSAAIAVDPGTMTDISTETPSSQTVELTNTVSTENITQAEPVSSENVSSPATNPPQQPGETVPNPAPPVPKTTHSLIDTELSSTANETATETAQVPVPDTASLEPMTETTVPQSLSSITEDVVPTLDTSPPPSAVPDTDTNSTITDSASFVTANPGIFAPLTTSENTAPSKVVEDEISTADSTADVPPSEENTVPEPIPTGLDLEPPTDFQESSPDNSTIVAVPAPPANEPVIGLDDSAVPEDVPLVIQNTEVPVVDPLSEATNASENIRVEPNPGNNLESAADTSDLPDSESTLPGGKESDMNPPDVEKSAAESEPSPVREEETGAAAITNLIESAFPNDEALKVESSIAQEQIPTDIIPTSPPSSTLNKQGEDASVTEVPIGTGTDESNQIAAETAFPETLEADDKIDEAVANQADDDALATNTADDQVDDTPLSTDIQEDNVVENENQEDMIVGAADSKNATTNSTVDEESATEITNTAEDQVDDTPSSTEIQEGNVTADENREDMTVEAVDSTNATINSAVDEESATEITNTAEDQVDDTPVSTETQEDNVVADENQEDMTVEAVDSTNATTNSAVDEESAAEIKATVDTVEEAAVSQTDGDTVPVSSTVDDGVDEAAVNTEPQESNVANVVDEIQGDNVAEGVGPASTFDDREVHEEITQSEEGIASIAPSDDPLSALDGTIAHNTEGDFQDTTADSETVISSASDEGLDETVVDEVLETSMADGQITEDIGPDVEAETKGAAEEEVEEAVVDTALAPSTTIQNQSDGELGQISTVATAITSEVVDTELHETPDNSGRDGGELDESAAGLEVASNDAEEVNLEEETSSKVKAPELQEISEPSGTDGNKLEEASLDLEATVHDTQDGDPEETTSNVEAPESSEAGLKPTESTGDDETILIAESIAEEGLVVRDSVDITREDTVTSAEIPATDLADPDVKEISVEADNTGTDANNEDQVIDTEATVTADRVDEIELEISDKAAAPELAQITSDSREVDDGERVVASQLVDEVPSSQGETSGVVEITPQASIVDDTVAGNNASQELQKLFVAQPASVPQELVIHTLRSRFSSISKEEQWTVDNISLLSDSHRRSRNKGRLGEGMIGYNVNMSVKCKTEDDCVRAIGITEDYIRNGSMTDEFKTHGTDVEVKLEQVADERKSEANVGMITGVLLGGIGVVVFVALGLMFGNKRGRRRRDDFGLSGQE